MQRYFSFFIYFFVAVVFFQSITLKLRAMPQRTSMFWKSGQEARGGGIIYIAFPLLIDQASQHRRVRITHPGKAHRERTITRLPAGLLYNPPRYVYKRERSRVHTMTFSLRTFSALPRSVSTTYRPADASYCFTMARRPLCCAAAFNPCTTQRVPFGRITLDGTRPID